MEKEKLNKLALKLIHEVEEEDIGISLLITYRENEEELRFFTKEDRARVEKILEKLAVDSKAHKGYLKRIIECLREASRG